MKNLSIRTILFFILFNLMYPGIGLCVVHFPILGEMRVRVDFWKKVYTEISTQEAFIHDEEDLSIIYKKVSLPKGSKARQRAAKTERRKIRNILNSILRKNYENLNEEEQSYANIIGTRSKKELRRMMRSIRYQYGLRDRYYDGLIKSYAYMDFIKLTFNEMGLPKELSYLPHVESSFNYHAYSKVGAAGIWQFMRSTGRHYGLKVGYVIDERLDPIKATKAAARLLRDNYRSLESWPLALTAYNHGARSIKRAVKKLKTKDINKIVDDYDGRRFGFASQNFYATFMATVEISENPQSYFPKFVPPEPHTYATLKLPHPLTTNQLKSVLDLPLETIKEYNPFIRRRVYRTKAYLPKGLSIRVPENLKSKLADYSEKLNKMKTNWKNDPVRKLHIISHGENLYEIAMLYHVPINRIINANELSNPSLVYPGMKLVIPK